MKNIKVKAPLRRLADVVCQLSRMAITNALPSVNQRLVSPSFGDLAEWLCQAFCWVSQMASSDIRCFIGISTSSQRTIIQNAFAA